MTPRRYTYNASQELHTSTSPHLQRASRAPELPPPRPHTYITPRRLHDCSAPPDLPSSIPLRGNTPAARLQSSRALEANTCTPAVRLPSSRAPLCLYVCTPAASLPNSIPPRL